MIRRHTTLLLFLLAIAAVGPFVVRTLFVHRPEVARTRAAFADLEEQRREESRDLSSRLASLEPAGREAADRVVALQRERHRIRTDLHRATLRLERTEATGRRLQSTLTDLTARIGRARAVHDSLQPVRADLSSRRTELTTRVDALDRRLARVDAETRTVREHAQRLATERKVWESYQTWHSLPRAALHAVLLRGDNNCGGAEASLWLFRPGRRTELGSLGLKAGLLVEDRRHQTERAYFGPSWQLLFGRRLHLDLWAGPYLAESAGSLAVDPAGGATLGWSFPDLHAGLGLVGLRTADDTMVGLSLGYSQVGRAVDPYGGTRR